MNGTNWYIWSIEHNAWWKPAHRGYTPNRDEAGVYPYEEALRIVQNANEHRDENQPPNEAMVLADKVSEEIVAPFITDLPTCGECGTQAVFIEVDREKDVELYQCECGELEIEKPVIDN